jgi:hypothetical protein
MLVAYLARYMSVAVKKFLLYVCISFLALSSVCLLLCCPLQICHPYSDHCPVGAVYAL